MISINVYDLLQDNDGQTVREIEAFEYNEDEIINDYQEQLQTYLIRNNLTTSGYRNFRIVTDKVYDQTVRVKGEVVRHVIMQETYQAYYKEENRRPDGIGALITLCRKEDSLKVKNILGTRCQMKLEPHSFDILRIIEQASDVRNARFNVQIETVTSVSMRGTRVNDTQYYARMLQQGNIRAVIITFDMPNQTVTFRISVEGTILLYSQLNDNEILDLVEDLLNI